MFGDATHGKEQQFEELSRISRELVANKQKLSTVADELQATIELTITNLIDQHGFNPHHRRVTAIFLYSILNIDLKRILELTTTDDQHQLDESLLEKQQKLQEINVLIDQLTCDKANLEQNILKATSPEILKPAFNKNILAAQAKKWQRLRTIDEGISQLESDIDSPECITAGSEKKLYADLEAASPEFAKQNAKHEKQSSTAYANNFLIYRDADNEELDDYYADLKLRLKTVIAYLFVYYSTQKFNDILLRINSQAKIIELFKELVIEQEEDLTIKLARHLDQCHALYDEYLQIYLICQKNQAIYTTSVAELKPFSACQAIVTLLAKALTLYQQKVMPLINSLEGRFIEVYSLIRFLQVSIQQNQESIISKPTEALSADAFGKLLKHLSSTVTVPEELCQQIFEQCFYNAAAMPKLTAQQEIINPTIFRYGTFTYGPDALPGIVTFQLTLIMLDIGYTVTFSSTCLRLLIEEKVFPKSELLTVKLSPYMLQVARHEVERYLRFKDLEIKIKELPFLSYLTEKYRNLEQRFRSNIADGNSKDFALAAFEEEAHTAIGKNPPSDPKFIDQRLLNINTQLARLAKILPRVGAEYSVQPLQKRVLETLQKIYKEQAAGNNVLKNYLASFQLVQEYSRAIYPILRAANKKLCVIFAAQIEATRVIFSEMQNQNPTINDKLTAIREIMDKINLTMQRTLYALYREYIREEELAEQLGLFDDLVKFSQQYREQITTLLPQLETFGQELLPMIIALTKLQLTQVVIDVDKKAIHTWDTAARLVKLHSKSDDPSIWREFITFVAQADISLTIKEQIRHHLGPEKATTILPLPTRFWDHGAASHTESVLEPEQLSI